MSMTKVKPAEHPRSARGDLSRAAAETLRERVDLRGSLLDAAVAGLVLSFNPQDSETREIAERSWGKIRLFLSRHVLSEGETVLPLGEKELVFPQTATRRLKTRHEELRSLVQRVDSASFAYGRSDEVAAAGRALRALAIKLDDLIGRKGRGLMPVLRRYVFRVSDAVAFDNALNC
jgi:hypothetical protein